MRYPSALVVLGAIATGAALAANGAGSTAPAADTLTSPAATIAPLATMAQPSAAAPAVIVAQATVAQAPATPAPAPEAPAAQAPPAPPPAAAPAATPPPPPPPVPLEQAVMNAAKDLFSKAALPGTDEKLELVVDPLIDGSTGFQTVEAERIGTRIASLVRGNYPRFDLQPFNAASVARQPIVLIGTFTPISAAGQAGGPKDAYRVCLALADLKSGKLVAKGFARAQTDGVNPTPVAFFRDSPGWVQDAATEAYIKSCQGTKIGDPIKPVYVERIEAAALVADGIKAYDAGKYKDAAAFYEKAAAAKGGDQLRVYNGLYLASQKLGKRKEAADAFAKLVAYGFKNKELAVKLLFRVGTAEFLSDKAMTGAYPMWLEKIAAEAANGDDCVEVIGHTSHTGTEAANDALSLKRAEVVKARLLRDAPKLKEKAKGKGVGWRENLIGTGRDDASDALDRRVAFKIGKCA